MQRVVNIIEGKKKIYVRKGPMNRHQLMVLEYSVGFIPYVPCRVCIQELEATRVGVYVILYYRNSCASDIVCSGDGELELVVGSEELCGFAFRNSQIAPAWLSKDVVAGIQESIELQR